MTREYPNTMREFFQMFPDEKSCLNYLIGLRWATGFVCPACHQTSIPWHKSRNRLSCPLCRHHVTVTADTIFEKTRTPLTTWFEAAWLVSTAKNGLSAKTLERTIGASYHVAWMMLQRFRVAMVNAERTKLTGTVEVDETFVGGEEHGGKRGRGADKDIVVIAVEIREGKGFWRTRMRHIPDASGDSLVARNDLLCFGLNVLHDFFQVFCSFTNEGFGNAEFDAIEFFVQSIQAGGSGVFDFLVSGVNGGLDVTSDNGHQINDGRKKPCSFALLNSVCAKNGIEFLW